MRSPLLALALPLALLVPAVPAAQAAPVPTEASADRAAAARAEQAPDPPAAGAQPSSTGLDNPWDVKRLPAARLLVTERDRARLSTYANGARERRSTSRAAGSGCRVRPG